jgi:hypothetical protein
MFSGSNTSIKERPKAGSQFSSTVRGTNKAQRCVVICKLKKNNIANRNKCNTTFERTNCHQLLLLWGRKCAFNIHVSCSTNIPKELQWYVQFVHATISIMISCECFTINLNFVLSYVF